MRVEITSFVLRSSVSVYCWINLAALEVKKMVMVTMSGTETARIRAVSRSCKLPRCMRRSEIICEKQA